MDTNKLDVCTKVSRVALFLFCMLVTIAKMFGLRFLCFPGDMRNEMCRSVHRSGRKTLTTCYLEDLHIDDRLSLKLTLNK